MQPELDSYKHVEKKERKYLIISNETKSLVSPKHYLKSDLPHVFSKIIFIKKYEMVTKIDDMYYG